jgi:sodium transport system permease protein
MIREILTVAGKEIRGMLRDRRALFMAFIFPMLLFPALFSVAVNDNSAASMMTPERIRYSISGSGVLSASLAAAQRNTLQVPSNDPESSLKRGEIHVILRDESAGPSGAISIIHDNTRQSSISSAAFFQGLLEEHAAAMNPSPRRKIAVTGTSESAAGSGTLLLSILLPAAPVVFASLTPIAMAADLGAGEKERGTISGLLSMPVKRSSIVAGKYLAIAMSGTMGLISFMCGTALAFLVNPGFFGRENIRLSMDPGCAALAAGAALLLVMLFSAIELAISLLARSVREAQIIFVPVLMTAMASGYGAFFHDPKALPALLRHVPVLNLSLTVKQLCVGTADPSIILPALAWSIFYIMLFLATALFLLGGEKIILPR